MAKLKVETTRAPMGYGWVGYFKTVNDAQDWVNCAIASGKNYPFWLQKVTMPEIPNKHYSLWWKKPKNQKLAGKGFGGH